MNKNMKPPKKATARTTTIRIEPPSDFTQLEEQYQLVRYVLPEPMLYSKDKFKFGRLHNLLKEQIDAPYRSFTHDYLDGSRRWAVYVLYARQKELTDGLPIIQFEGNQLPSRELKFDEPKLHILIKLLQVNYFRSSENKNQNRFVGQDKCYIYARRRSEETSRYHICLEIEMKGDLQDENTFYVYGQARTFAKQETVDLSYADLHTYYTLSEIRDGLLMFRQVKRSEVGSVSNLYERRTFTGSRTTLSFHDQDDVEQSRGYLVDTFIQGFVQYLSQFDFQVEHIQREFQRHDESEVEDFKLPVGLLNTVYVYDARFRGHYDLITYLAEFQKQFDGLDFEIVAEITPNCPMPVLIFEDCEAKAFQEDMPLHGQNDPHQQLYQDLPLVTKQFVNVNGNDPEKGSPDTDYLDYELELPNEHQRSMILNQLLLKDLILRERDVTERLPFAPTNLMFVHRENRGRGQKKQEYEIATYFEGNIVRFLNLSDRTERTTFYDLVDELGVDWDNCYEQLRARYKKNNNGEDLSTYDVIVGPGLFVDIEDAHEALLYEYEEILRRIEEYNQSFSLDDLKLADQYDILVDDETLSEDYLLMWGYIQKPRPLGKPKNKKHRAAVELYFALQEYDAFLEELKPRYEAITFRTLTGDASLMDRIRSIFNFKTGRGLQDLYKRVGKFAGVREEDVIPIYRGIWYMPDDMRYVVGDTNGMNSVQARAHRVRRFVVYQGAEAFDIRSMLDAMSVKFVRLKQYTVYPYYFHLIDLYIDNVLTHHTHVVESKFNEDGSGGESA
ncbi:MAG: hypothetical protein K8J31_03060 [Anaerolineae bacterium]|nr:hypothetical protein [Anaerolineae bacterium]